MKVLEITKQNFEREVLQAEKPVIIDFWASWCGPCRMMSPIIDEIAEENTQIVVGKVNVDEQSELAIQFDVMSIPTIIAFKDGKVMNSLIGVHQKEDVLNMIKK